jgi:steroid 5-alpha reductase family enzyme
MLQAGFTVLFSLPFWVVAQNPVAGVTAWLVAGVAVFVVAVAGEAIADHQLARFRADPANRGRVCEVGLWRYSRHPNYFFEWLHWFSYVLLGVGAAWWWITPLGAVLMGASLAWITGIPFVEAQSLRSRGEAYRDYQRRTSAFFPWFPRRVP